MCVCVCVCVVQVNAITGGLFTSEVMEAAAKSKDVTSLDTTVYTCHMTRTMTHNASSSSSSLVCGGSSLAVFSVCWCVCVCVCVLQADSSKERLTKEGEREGEVGTLTNGCHYVCIGGSLLSDTSHFSFPPGSLWNFLLQ